jgi:hypothetical protein
MNQIGEDRMTKPAISVSPTTIIRTSKLRSDLARRIALLIGSAENSATDIFGLTLHRRTAPTAPCPATYEPSVTVIAQGKKQVELGRTTLIYDGSHYLLTSIDLPIVSRVIEASEKLPCIAMVLKLEMPVDSVASAQVSTCKIARGPETGSGKLRIYCRLFVWS